MPVRTRVRQVRIYSHLQFCQISGFITLFMIDRNKLLHPGADISSLA